MAAALPIVRVVYNGGPGSDGSAAQRAAFFYLLQGKLHLPSIQGFFGLASMQLDGVGHPTDAGGLTAATFRPGATLQATGTPLPTGNLELPRVWLVRVAKAYAAMDPGPGGGKRRITWTQQVLGLWELPPLGQQPRTLVQLAAAIQPFLQGEERTPTRFKYSVSPSAAELVAIDSEAALAEALARLREVASSNQGKPPQQAVFGSLHFRTIGGQPSNDEVAAAVGQLERQLVATGYTPWRELRDREREALQAAQQAAQQAAKAEPVKKRRARQVEDNPAKKARDREGRHLDEVEHLSRLADMNSLLDILFDGKIAGLVEVKDHRQVLCRVCREVQKCPPYSTRAVQSHFLKRHEALLRAQGVDLDAWRR